MIMSVVCPNRHYSEIRTACRNTVGTSTTPQRRRHGMPPQLQHNNSVFTGIHVVNKINTHAVSTTSGLTERRRGYQRITID